MIKYLTLILISISAPAFANSECDVKLLGGLPGIVELALREKVRTSDQIRNWLESEAARPIEIRQTLTPTQLPVAQALVKMTGSISPSQWSTTQTEVRQVLDRHDVSMGNRKKSRKKTGGLIRPALLKSIHREDAEFESVAWTTDQLGQPILAISDRAGKVAIQSLNGKINKTLPPDRKFKGPSPQAPKIAWLKNQTGQLTLAAATQDKSGQTIVRFEAYGSKAKISPIFSEIPHSSLHALIGTGEHLFALVWSRQQGSLELQLLNPKGIQPGAPNFATFRSERPVIQTRDGRILAAGLRKAAPNQTVIVIAELIEGQWREIFEDSEPQEIGPFPYVGLLEKASGELVLVYHDHEFLKIRYPSTPGAETKFFPLSLFSANAVHALGEAEDNRSILALYGRRIDDRGLSEIQVFDLDKAELIWQDTKPSLPSGLTWLEDANGGTKLAASVDSQLEILDPLNGIKPPLAKIRTSAPREVHYLQIEGQVFAAYVNSAVIHVYSILSKVKP